MWNLGMANIAEAGEVDFMNIMKVKLPSNLCRDSDFLVPANQYQMIIPGSVLYVTSLWLIKFALVLFYKKLAAPGSGLQIAYNVTLGVLAVTWLVIFFDIIFQCFPNDKRWSTDPSCTYIAFQHRRNAGQRGGAAFPDANKSQTSAAQKPRT